MSDIPGTTDSIQVGLEVAGVPVTVTDTAGWRQTDDPEKEGIDRAKQAAAEADVLVVVLNGSCANWSADMDEIITWSSKTSLCFVEQER